jgi:prepilin-type N-terminal cleavage/methylation domain-containing protein/prepilin-type processing-associated H-X9-DG protein
VKTLPSSTKIRRKRGITLIEILVTITIIAVLAFIVFAMTTRVRAKAKSVLCIQNLRDWSVVFARSSQDRNGRLPTPVNWAAISNVPYNPSPSAPTPGRSPFVDYWADNLQQAMLMQLNKRSCPCLKSESNSSGNRMPTYMMNTQLSRPPQFLEMHETDMLRASAKILFIDGSAAGPLRISDHSEVDLWVRPAAEAHGGKVNAVFADLHVGTIEPHTLSKNWDDLMVR